MAIKRAVRDTNFTIINNVGLKDNRLSAKATGLLAYMLSLPDDWVFYETELVKHFTDGKESIRTGLKELENTGYLVRVQTRNEKGKFSANDWTVSDSPSTDFTLTDNTLSDNRRLLSTESTTKDLSIQNNIVVPTEVEDDSKKTKDNQEKKESVPYKKIIEYLNNKVGSSLLFKAKGNQAPIKARWNEGYRLKDFESVIDFKFTDIYFKDNPQFFLPKTLFSNKFGDYLQKAKFAEGEKEKKKNKEENRITPEQLFELERLENEKEAERRYGSKQNQ